MSSYIGSFLNPPEDTHLANFTVTFLKNFFVFEFTGGPTFAWAMGGLMMEASTSDPNMVLCGKEQVVCNYTLCTNVVSTSQTDFILDVINLIP